MTCPRSMPARGPGLAACLLAASLLSACNEEEPPPPQARFERPNRVAFVCVENGQPVPFLDCDPDVKTPEPSRSEFALVTQSTRGEVAAVDLGTRSVLDNRRDIPGFTFVPVGETPIAIVVPPDHPEFTFVANFGSRDIRILDTAALVSPLTGDPTLAVFRLQTDAGAVAPTDMVLAPEEDPATPAQDALVVTAPDSGAVFWLPLDYEAPLPLTRCTGEDPSCPAGDVQGKVVIPLARSIERAQANPPPDITPSQYAQRCERAVAPLPDAGTADGGVVDGGTEDGGTMPDAGAPPPSEDAMLMQAEVPELPAGLAMTAPRPIALTIDAACAPDAVCTPRILVADEALPLIHALDLAVLRDSSVANPAEAALLDPLQTGVPTRAVAATPIVPATLEGGATKYVYAIDATDGSVLAIENGRVLAVGADSTRRSDRIDFSYGPEAPAPAAAALTVVTPLYEGIESPWLANGICAVRNPEDDPGILSGVFLAVALTDGTVRIVDIHDMELRQPDPASTQAPCRECSDDVPVLVRHQPRVDQRNPSTLTPEGSLEFVVDGVLFGVRNNGSSPTPSAPRLDCFACAADLVPIKPDRALGSGAMAGAGATDGGLPEVGAASSCTDLSTGLLCAPSDPWSGANDRWNAVFEGPIPGTFGGNGQFKPGTETDPPEFSVEVNPCLAGVLGTEEIGAALPGCEGARPVPVPGEPDRFTMPLHGDQLVIGTRPLSDQRLTELGVDSDTRERCAALAAALVSADPPLLSVEIRRAYTDRLLLRNALVNPVNLPDPLRPIVRIDEVMACMPGTPIAYGIRTLGSFTVRGSQSGFLHRVHADSANRCVVDPEADPLLQGRAGFGCAFRNREVMFRFKAIEEGERPPEPLVELRAQAVSRAVKLALSANVTGSVPVQLVWNPVDQQLYMVDISALGLVPMRLDPLPQTPAIAFN